MKSQAIIAAFSLPVVALALALSTGCAGGSTADSSSAAGDGGDGPSGTSGQGGSGQAVSGSGTGSGSGAGSGGTGGAPVMNNPNCNGGCATGQNWKWDGMPAPTQPYVPGAVTDGPMPPTQGGGSGLDPNGTPVTCYGGNFGEYSDNTSFCDYVANRFRYLENECGNFNTAFLTVDPSLAAIAQTEAEAVAGGKCPNGPQSCGNYAEMLYIDGWQGNYLSRSAMFTAPESNMMVGPPAWFTSTGVYPLHACQFIGEFANVMLYHYCVWEGTMTTGDPTTQPTRIGCGTAVDQSGVTWRVVQLGK